MSAIEVNHTIEIEADPEVVWGFLVDAEKMPRWMGVAAELDPRPGGVFSVDVLPGSAARGTFVEVEPVSRIVFTWGWEGTQLAPGSTTITVTLEPTATGTRLTLVHAGLDAVGAEQHDVGWAHYLERLRVAGGGGDPGPDPSLRREEGTRQA